MSDEEEVDEQLERIAMQMDNRWHQSRRFVEPCREWIDRHRAAQQDSQIPRAIAFANAATVDKVDELVTKFELEPDHHQQLLLAEDLADLLVGLIESRELAMRTLPSDSVENFYDIGGGHYECSDCGGRLAVVFLSAAEVCVHCYLNH